MAKKPPTLKSVETIKHDADKRKNIPTAEHQSVLQADDATPRPVKYPRNTNLDPQLVGRGGMHSYLRDRVTVTREATLGLSETFAGQWT